VGAVENVDRVELDSANIFHEPAQAWRRQRGRAGSSEVLSLEEEPGDGAQRNAAARHAAELIIDVMARRVPLLWLLAAIVLIVPLAYGLYPVASVVEGVGTIEPLFEDLVNRTRFPWTPSGLR
jgi:hypothetical protein